VSEFGEFLEAAAKRFPNKYTFAKKLGITPGRLSRVLGGEHSLDVENCLKLAKLTGESASRVLRLAGKSEIAELIEDLYGRTAPALSRGDREVLDEWDAMNAHDRQALRAVLQSLGARDKPHRTSAADRGQPPGETRGARKARRKGD